MNLHLLIIEDDPAIIADWNEKLEYYAVEDSPVYTIIPTFVSEINGAKILLENSDFDAAVIDIRLENTSGGPPNSDGNELFEIISRSSLTVSAICTGEPLAVNLDQQYDASAKIFEKGDGIIEDVLQWFDDKQSMISAIKNMQKSISAEMARVFSKSIWPRWNYWLGTDPELSELALTRHMASHLHASFLNEVSSVHPEEYYFIPPLRERLDTGDIFLIDGDLYILVTPRCDLAREQNPTFQLVRLHSIRPIWDELHHTKDNGENRAARDKAPKDIRKLINHGDRSPKLHFIPQIKLSDDNILGPFHAQFNFMNCNSADDSARITLTEQRIATLSNEFVPSLVERLGAYFSRIGTPDYSHPE